MTDCTNLAVDDRVCVNRVALGSVVRVLGRYVEVRHEECTRKYSRRDGFEWGGGTWNQNIIEPWDEEKHAPLVAKHDLKLARLYISRHVAKHADKLSIEQINEIKEILFKAEGTE